ncbi:unnamed protein product [Bemisia tabaci]|uniref:Uncharacterized protein n=1 Tax=Bemisia tabaci TaxID=7038 RepID=A0A9P0CD50_BEMTA|nr:unnamed protein product [Bemisia tabaci]
MELKIFITVFLVCGTSMLISCEARSADLTNEAVIHPELMKEVGLKDWMFERLIKKALEAFKRLMKKGDASKNIPVLDPLYTAADTAYYNSNDGVFEFKMESKNVTTTGLSEFVVNHVSASMFSLKADLDLTFTNINRKGTYKAKASLFQDVDVFYGDGSLDESVSNLNILLHLHFGLSLNKILYVKEVGVKFNVQQGSVNLDGLLNNSKLGKTVNKILSDGGANFVNKNRERIQPHINEAVKTRVSHLIDGMTLPELIQFLEALINA